MQTSLTIDTLSGIQPTLIGDYMTDFKHLQKQCPVSDIIGVNCGQIHEKKRIIDNESILLGLDRIITKYEPKKIKPVDNTQEEVQQNSKSNNNRLIAESTRVNRPCNILSGVNINRFEENLNHNPQNVSNIVFSEDIRGGLNSRNLLKDNQCNF